MVVVVVVDLPKSLWQRIDISDVTYCQSICQPERTKQDQEFELTDTGDCDF